MQFITEIINNVNLEMIFRLIVAALLGLLIGLERELKRKSLGLKTILVISVVSCLLTIVSIQSAYILPSSPIAEIRMDPLRLAAQIISGVGFLGAGVILKREGDTITGLTTAAIVWGAAGIGIAIGAGFYIEATIGVILLLVSIEFIPFLMKQGFQKLKLKEYHVNITLENRESIENILKQIESNVVQINNTRIKDMDTNHILIELFIMIRTDEQATEVYQRLTKISDVKLVEIFSTT